jgi:protein-S-isoprenylcysteine O-methyltransferase Ste14
MFKKIHSNRPAEATLLSELGKEFRVYLRKVRRGVLLLLRKFPKSSFGLMIFLMLASMIFSFVVFRQALPKSSAVKVPSAVVVPVQDGFGQILKQSEALRRTIAIKQEIEVMLARDSLSPADSLRLTAAIDELQRLSTSSPKSHLP